MIPLSPVAETAVPTHEATSVTLRAHPTARTTSLNRTTRRGGVRKKEDEREEEKWRGTRRRNRLGVMEGAAPPMNYRNKPIIKR